MLGGLAMGGVNALFGAGGGILTVPYLKKSGVALKKAHATSIAIIFPLSFLSACIYYFRGLFTLSESLLYIPGGIVGAVAGAFLLKKLPDFFIKKVFALFIIYASLKMLLR